MIQVICIKGLNEDAEHLCVHPLVVILCIGHYMNMRANVDRMVDLFYVGLLVNMVIMSLGQWDQRRGKRLVRMPRTVRCGSWCV